jgi:hypothetical protein
MRSLQLLAVLLLSVVWGAAQTASPATQTDTNTTTASPSATTSTTSNSGTKASTSSDASMSQTNAGGDSVEGCLGGSDGNYTLTDQSGNSYRLTGDTAKLSEHIGHEVKVSGTKSTATATGSSDTMGQTGGSQQAIQVTSVKHVAKTCQNSATTPSK